MFTTRNIRIGVEVLDSEGHTVLLVMAQDTKKVADWVVGLMNADEEAQRNARNGESR